MRNENEWDASIENPLNPIPHYRAPKPKNPWKPWSIISRVLFPVILAWDLAKMVANRILGRWLGKFIIRAQNSPALDKEHLENKIRQLSSSEITFQKLIAETHDKVELDTLEIRHSAQTGQSPNQKKYIVCFRGYDSFYESHVDEMVEDAKIHQCNVIGFNLRRVGESSKIRPRNKDDLITDGIAQVQRLLDQGVASENIILKGHSMGGAIATDVAGYFLKQKKEMYLFNDRSFSTLTNVVVGWLRTGKISGHKETPPRILLGWIAKPVIWFVLHLTGWAMEPIKNYRKIRPKFKKLLVVRSSRTARENIHSSPRDDIMITHYGAMHTGLKPERRQEKARIDDQIKSLSHVIKNSSDLIIRQKLEEAIAHLRDQRESLKIVKMTKDVQPKEIISDEPVQKIETAHKIALDQLTDRYHGQSGATFFNHFVEEAWRPDRIPSSPLISR